MLPAETKRSIQPVLRASLRLRGFPPPFQDKGVSLKASLKTIQSIDSATLHQKAPEGSGRPAAGGKRDDRSELGLEFPKKVTSQEAVEIEPAKDPRFPVLRRVIIGGMLRNNRDKGMIRRHPKASLPALKDTFAGKSPLQNHKRGLSPVPTIPTVSRMGNNPLPERIGNSDLNILSWIHFHMGKYITKKHSPVTALNVRVRSLYRIISMNL